MAKKVIEMNSKDIENVIHTVLDPSWRMADRDNRAISKLAKVIDKLLEKAYGEGYEKGGYEGGGGQLVR